MELELNRNPMACFEPVLETTLFHEETISGAFPTPEYCFNKAVEIPKLY